MFPPATKMLPEHMHRALYYHIQVFLLLLRFQNQFVLSCPSPFSRLAKFLQFVSWNVFKNTLPSQLQILVACGVVVVRCTA